MTRTTDHVPPLPVFTNTMVPGITRGTAGVLIKTDDVGNSYTDVSEVLVAEDVTVPAGTYYHCLKIYRQRAFT